jgi:hypothetical protein
MMGELGIEPIEIEWLGWLARDPEELAELGLARTVGFEQLIALVGEQLLADREANAALPPSCVTASASRTATGSLPAPWSSGYAVLTPRSARRCSISSKPPGKTRGIKR